MTLIEASKRFQISIDYTEDELHKVGIIHSLLKAGMDITLLRRYLQLLCRKMENKDEQVRILRKQRYQLLEEIHRKQQSLDELDYMIEEIRKG